MTRILPNSRSSKRWGFFLGLLCVALVLFGGTLQAVHTHASGDLTHADCSLCATAHVVAQVVSNPVPVPAELAVTPTPTFGITRHLERTSDFALFTRPPPADSTLA